MTKYTPETGYPSFALDNERPCNDDDVFEFANGISYTGAQYNQMMENYRNSARGQALLAHMRGEGPEPEPLMTLDEIMGERRAYLGDREVEITDVDPDLDILFDELGQGDK